MDARDGDGADASDAGEPRLLESSHRALDATGGFVNPSDLHALRVVSKTASDSRVLVATKRVVTQRWTACAASKRARRRLEAVDAMGRLLGPHAEEFLTAIFRDDKLQTVRAAAATWLARVARCAGPLTKQRIFHVACERYDAEAGRMTVRQAIERAFPDVYQSYEEVARMHLPPRARCASSSPAPSH